MAQTNDGGVSGFPPGYFVIRSAATGRVFDVIQDSVEDGTEIALWPEKEKSLVEKIQKPIIKQVFFIDTSGALCSRSAGHAIDIEGDRLVLRHRRPVSLPFPNAYAHPLPKFSYSSKTGNITVTFECDPSYPAHGGPVSNAWKNKTYLLTAIPMRRPRTIIDDASQFITSSILTPISFFTGTSVPSSARPDEVFNGDIDLAEEDVVEEERGDEAEMDDSPEFGRKMKMISVPTGEKDMLDLLLSEKARSRRRWQILPLRVGNARTIDVTTT